MDASIIGALSHINTSYKSFEHKGSRMTKEDVRRVLEYGAKKGYNNVSELSDEDVDIALGAVKDIRGKEKETKDLKY